MDDFASLKRREFAKKFKKIPRLNKFSQCYTLFYMKKAILPVTFLIVFIVFTVLVKTIDVSAIGPLGSAVGFSTLNAWARDALGQNGFCYSLTQILGGLALLTAFAEALMGCIQLVKRKSLLKVDRRLIVLGLVYIAMIVLYFAFEKFPVNFRPVLEEGLLAPSYPSSHTMVILTVFGSTFFFAGILKNFTVRTIVKTLCIIFVIAATAGRLLSGVHWLTDILGGVLVSAFLVSSYVAAGER